MDGNSCTINRFKAQCNKFSGNISRGLSVAKQHLVKQMIYGIQASKDVKLSNISRALQEDIALIKTQDRLSRNLHDIDLTQHINSHILRLGDDKVNDSMVIAIDPGDMMKPYAKAMENLCGIYDGSAGSKAIGYHSIQVTAANLEHNKIVPLYSEAYSSKEENYPGGTTKLISVIAIVKASIGTKGTWAIDRVGDNDELIQNFLKEDLQFVTRLKLNRWLHIKGNKVAQVQAERVSRHIPLQHKAVILKMENGKAKTLHLRFGATIASFPGFPDQWFTLLVIEGFGEKPMILITNKTVHLTNPKSIWQMVEIYLTRWKCDECFRYIKQSYNLEDFRVRSYISIRNINVLVHAIAYFSSVYMGLSLKLNIMVQKIFILSKRFFGIPSFYNYAMADGIFELLKLTKNLFIIFLR
jgi:hypothetical protein